MFDADPDSIAITGSPSECQRILPANPSKNSNPTKLGGFDVASKDGPLAISLTDRKRRRVGIPDPSDFDVRHDVREVPKACVIFTRPGSASVPIVSRRPCGCDLRCRRRVLRGPIVFHSVVGIVSRVLDFVVGRDPSQSNLTGELVVPRSEIYFDGRSRCCR